MEDQDFIQTLCETDLNSITSLASNQSRTSCSNYIIKKSFWESQAMVEMKPHWHWVLRRYEVARSSQSQSESRHYYKWRPRSERIVELAPRLNAAWVIKRGFQVLDKTVLKFFYSLSITRSHCRALSEDRICMLVTCFALRVVRTVLSARGKDGILSMLSTDIQK